MATKAQVEAGRKRRNKQTGTQSAYSVYGTANNTFNTQKTETKQETPRKVFVPSPQMAGSANRTFTPTKTVTKQATPQTTQPTATARGDINPFKRNSFITPAQTEINPFKAIVDQKRNDITGNSIKTDALNFKRSGATSANQYLNTIKRIKGESYANLVAKEMRNNRDLSDVEYETMFGEYERSRKAGFVSDKRSTGQKIKDFANALYADTATASIQQKGLGGIVGKPVQKIVEHFLPDDVRYALEDSREQQVRDLSERATTQHRKDDRQALKNVSKDVDESKDTYDAVTNREKTINSMMTDAMIRGLGVKRLSSDSRLAERRLRLAGYDTSDMEQATADYYNNEIQKAFDKKTPEEQQNFIEMLDKYQEDLKTNPRFEYNAPNSDFAKYAKEGAKNKDSIIEKNKVLHNNPSADMVRVQNITPEQKQRYDFVLGKYGSDVAKKYWDNVLALEIDETMAQEQMRKTADFANRHKVVGGALNATSSLVQGQGYISDVGDSFKQAFTDTDIPTNPNKREYGATRNVIATEQGITKDMNGVQKFFADAVLSAGQNIVNLPLGSMGLFNLGLGAAAQSTYEKEQQGFSREQALKYGTIAGGVEILTEKLPFDIQRQAFKSGKNGMKAVLENLFKGAVSEGLEEGAGNIIQNVADIWTFGERSEYEQYRQSLISQYTKDGMTQNEAEEKATGEALKKFFVSDTFMNALAGAVSGGMVTGAGAMTSSTAAAVDTAVDDYNTGKAIKAEGGAQEVFTSGKLAQQGSYAYEQAKKGEERYHEKGKVSNYTVGRQARLNIEQALSEGDTVRAISEALNVPIDEVDTDDFRGLFETDNGRRKISLSSLMDNSRLETTLHEGDHAMFDILKSSGADNLIKQHNDFVYDMAKKENPQAVKGYEDRIRADYEKRGQNVADEVIKEEVGAEIASHYKLTAEMINDAVKNNKGAVRKMVVGYERAKAKIRDMLSKGAYTEYRNGMQMTYSNLQKGQEMYLNALAQASRQNGTESTENNVRYMSVEYDKYGNAYVKIDEDILKDVPDEDRFKIVRDELRKRFSKGIEYNGKIIAVSGKSRREFTGSRYTQHMENEEQKDKLRMAANLDEIVNNQTGVANEDPEHERTDDIVSFDRGYITVEVGTNGYTAEVLIANKNDGTQSFHDLLELKPTKIQHQSQSGRQKENTEDGDNDVVSDDNISNPDENVKPQNEKSTSRRQMSNENDSFREQQIHSENFKNWFGDWENDPENASKVVNEDGTPKVVYRGDDSEFYVFDRKKSKYSNLYGKGFYFTDSKSHASQYGNVREFYLDIKTPLQIEQHNITKQQLKAFLSAVAENEDYDLYNYGTTDIDKIANDLYGKGDFEMLQDINATAIGDLVEAIELFNEINGTKYDGIILPQETVVFDPTQIKSATDNIGTFDKNNPDIRYQFANENDSFSDQQGMTENERMYVKLAQERAKSQRLENTINNAQRTEKQDNLIKLIKRAQKSLSEQDKLMLPSIVTDANADRQVLKLSEKQIDDLTNRLTKELDKISVKTKNAEYRQALNNPEEHLSKLKENGYTPEMFINSTTEQLTSRVKEGKKLSLEKLQYGFMTKMVDDVFMMSALETQYKKVKTKLIQDGNYKSRQVSRLGQDIADTYLPKNITVAEIENVVDEIHELIGKSDFSQENLEKARAIADTLSEQVINNSEIKFDNEIDKDREIGNLSEQIVGIVHYNKPSLFGRQSPYTMSVNAKDANARAEYILKNQLRDFNGKYLGKGWRDVIRPLAEAGKKDKDIVAKFNTYLTLQRAYELSNAPVQKRKNVLGGKDADLLNDPIAQKETIDALEQKYPKFKDWAEDIYNYIDKLTYGWLVEGGIISIDEYRTLRQQNPHYVPLNRDLSNEFDGKTGLGVKDPIQKFKGGSANIYAPLESIVVMTAKYVNTVAKNSAMQAAVGIYDDLPEDASIFFYEVGKDENGKWVEKKAKRQDTENHKRIRELTDNIRKNGLSAQEQFEYEKIFQAIKNELPRAEKNKYQKVVDWIEKHRNENLSSAQAQDIDLTPIPNANEIIEKIANNIEAAATVSADNITSVIINGETRYFKVDDMFKTAIESVKPEEVSGLFRGYMLAVGTFKALCTSLKPAFTLYSNTVNDFRTAANTMNSANPLDLFTKVYGPSLKHQLQHLGHDISKTKAGRKLLRGGISNSEIYEMYKAMGAEYTSAFSTGKNLEDMVKQTTKLHDFSYANIYGKVGDAVEATPRLGGFNLSLKQGQDVHQAHFESKRITVNFALGGTWGRKINRVIPFFGPAMQGLYNMIKTFKYHPVRFATLYMAGQILPALISAILNRRDDEIREAYYKLSNWVKNSYTVIGYHAKDGEVKFLTFPKAKEYGVPTSAAERMADVLVDNDKDAFKGFATYVIDNVIPNLTPDDIFLLGTYIALKSNKNYMGAKIVPDNLKDLDKRLQYDENTSWYAVKLGELTGQSPKQIDYVLSDMFVSLQETMSNMFPQGRRFVPSEAMWAGAKSAFGGIGKRLISDPIMKTDKVGLFYANKEKTDVAAASYKEAGKYGTLEDVYKSKKYEQAANVMSAINKFYKKDLDRDEKKLYVDYAIQQKDNPIGYSNEVVKELLSLYDQENSVVNLPPIPDNIKINGKEYKFKNGQEVVNYQEGVNNYVSNAYLETMNSWDYQLKDEQDRAKMLKNVKDTAIKEFKEMFVSKKGKVDIDLDKGKVSEYVPTEQDIVSKNTNDMIADISDRITSQKIKGKDGSYVDTSSYSASSLTLQKSNLSNQFEKDGEKFYIPSDVIDKHYDELNKQFVDCVNKVFNGEMSLDEALDYVDKWGKTKHRTTNNPDGTKTDLTGYVTKGDDGKYNFDDLQLGKIIKKIKETSIDDFAEDWYNGNLDSTDNKEKSETKNVATTQGGNYNVSKGKGTTTSKAGSGGGTVQTRASAPKQSNLRLMASANPFETNANLFSRNNAFNVASANPFIGRNVFKPSEDMFQINLKKMKNVFNA